MREASDRGPRNGVNRAKNIEPFVYHTVSAFSCLNSVEPCCFRSRLSLGSSLGDSFNCESAKICWKLLADEVRGELNFG